ncbi:hypothetical protein BSLA_03r0356 [Burkholderia stabilis]|nr:hypothetical protein BSLA_03r0356 [Burkholderia stabilis]
MTRCAFEAPQEIQRRQTPQSLCQSHISHTAASKLHPLPDKSLFASPSRFLSFEFGNDFILKHTCISFLFSIMTFVFIYRFSARNLSYINILK